MKKVKVRVFVVDDERIKDYGGLITVSGIVDSYERIVCRVIGASTIYKGKKVGVEIFDKKNRKKKVIIGEKNIKEELWKIMIRWLS
ncbi:hypothetical protein J7J41_00405 [bacterium]|nr:hypothetical protein [bacterium]